MSRADEDLSDLLGPDPEAEVLVDEAPVAPKSRPMGEDSRALLNRSRTYDVRRAVAKKNSPERLGRLLKAASENAVANSACLRAGISYTTLKYWLQKSSEGAPGDGFDIVLGENDETENEDNTIRFHDAWDFAMQAGVEKLEAVVMERATGFRETLTYQGRVIYQKDPVLLELGFEGEQALLRDKFGAPVPETVWKMDPDLAMFLLKARKPQVYGAKASVDVNVRGGVLVVGVRAATSQALNVLEEQYRKEGRPAVTFDEGEGED